MKNQDILALRELVGGIGDFIRYWGFRKIHGQIWALVYLSKSPLSGSDLVKLLKVSKALVSPALKELEKEGLIVVAKSENAKVKRYSAVEDVEAVIRRVLQTREKQMMIHIQKAFVKVEGRGNFDLSHFVESSRLQSMGRMIETAQMGLELLLNAENFWK